MSVIHHPEGDLKKWAQGVSPGYQTYISRGSIIVRRGPTENLHRPAIDPLFRTAAHHYSSRVC